MRGTIRWNYIFGAVGSIFALMVSWSNNVWTTSLLRAIIAFVIWFGLAYGVRFALGVLLSDDEGKQPEAGASKNPNAGTMLDMTTPDEEDVLRDLLRPNGADSKSNPVEDEGGSFQPLQPPKLVTKAQPDAEELAQAVRHFVQK
ncbi:MULTISPECIES: hypothetical protein [Paenibacillus]|uniref:Uncharacterized protein n=2 Tax=Paenibacillus TaxID=44249 RepID=A0AAJ2JUW8_9BACL|nr:MULTISPECIES: hypothetical protein [Paenibacillus]EPY10040.1 hypothetical protein PAAL66ix_22870 [Paenibacillus alvei A6-6i-x]MCM3291695.1 hypothetical protein [Paenibacillus sp. MER 180]MCY9531209.1 hypothetical protein [Paenibacillus alvei]MDT8976727.1 hypothetical protein [Paenibacillus sp. chi10]OBY79316.1 hypothetical protein BBG47_11885 [Paenibacillus sp. KS1]